jgi:hypothetical protein
MLTVPPFGAFVSASRSQLSVQAGESMADARRDTGFVVLAGARGAGDAKPRASSTSRADCIEAATPLCSQAIVPPMPSATARHPARGRMWKEPESLSPFMNHS